MDRASLSQASLQSEVSETSLVSVQKRVLAHVRGEMTDEEIGFWDELSAELASRGAELFVIAYRRPRCDHRTPVLVVPISLQNAPVLSACTRWSRTDGRAVPREGELLQREAAWRGTPAEERLADWRAALCFYHEFYQQALMTVKPTVVLIWNGMHAQEMILDELSREAGCRVGYIERAPIPGMIHLDWEGILGGSSVAARTDWNWQSESEQTTWVNLFKGLERLMASGEVTWWEQPVRTDLASLRRRLGIPENRKVILFAGQVDADAQNLFFSSHYDSGKEALGAFCDALSNFDDVFLLGKHHPKAEVPAEAYRNTAERCGVWLEDVALADCFAVSDYVAAVNSTVLYEGLVRGLPALAMGQSLLSGKHIAYETEGAADLVDVVGQWLEKDDWACRQQRWRDFGGWLLQNAFFAYNLGDAIAGVRGAREFADVVLDSSDRSPCFDGHQITSLLLDVVEMWQRERGGRTELESDLRDLVAQHQALKTPAGFLRACGRQIRRGLRLAR